MCIPVIIYGSPTKFPQYVSTKGTYLTIHVSALYCICIEAQYTKQNASLLLHQKKKLDVNRNVLHRCTPSHLEYCLWRNAVSKEVVGC